MRKLLATIFGLFYIFISSWVVLNLHYCHGELAGVSLFSNKKCEHDENHGCDFGKECGLGKECCEFQMIQLGIEDEHSSPLISFERQNIVAAIDIPSEESNVIVEPEIYSNCSRDGPVRDLRLHYCSLIFYS